MKVGFISLGCSKNLVDTEMAIGLFKNHGYTIVNDPEKAEILVINTCGFIESAKEEAINTILEMAEYKKKNCQYLLVMGCLVQRYKEELEKAIPEVDLWIKYDSYATFWQQIQNALGKQSENAPMNFLDRVITTGENYAYVRIAEGCSNFCTYCAIPKIRGKFRSRLEKNILDEVKMLVDNGVKEIILIAQDLTDYGVDIYGKRMLHDLISKISKVEGVEWIRLLYCYPEEITDELIEEIARNEMERISI